MIIAKKPCETGLCPDNERCCAWSLKKWDRENRAVNHNEVFTQSNVHDMEVEYTEEKKGLRVVLESPFAGDVETNIEYARKCMRDSLKRGEYPIASHLLYTQKGILDDDIPEERKLGIDAGLDWGSLADKTVVYLDHGISKGMKYGIKNAEKSNRPIEYRSIL